MERKTFASARIRTGLAEDRTGLANERTFSGWVRTSLAMVGIGVGFHALFGTLSPDWIPKAIASLFISLGMLVIGVATWRARQVASRLIAHKVYALSATRLYLIAGVYCMGASALILAIWILV